MNKKIVNKIQAGIIAFAAIGLTYSCSDTWNEHYEDNALASGDTYLFQKMSEDSNLSDFCEVLKATGYDKILGENQIYTVFAPVNGSFDKASLISDINAGKKSSVIKRFVNNHISRYNYSATDTEKKLTLLNTKNVVMTKSDVDGVEINDSNILCKNGVLHVVNSQLPFRSNIFEVMEVDSTLSAAFKFLDSYQEDSLDEARSVYRGVDEDGNRIYVDSVIISTNKVMTSTDALIDREDSNYLVIVPTNEAYQKRYEQAKELLNLHAIVNDRDSLMELYANKYAMNNMYFNMNRSTFPNDSLVSTIYSKYDWEENVFYNPYGEGGILTNYVERIDCSNGELYKVDEYPISIYDAFFKEVEIETENLSSVNSDEDFTKTCTYERISTPGIFGGLVSKDVLDVKPTNSSANPNISFYLNNVLSGEYDIYVIMAPMSLKTFDELGDTLPCKFQANMFVKGENGKFPKTATYNFDKQAFSNDPAKVDSVYLGSYKFESTFIGESEAGWMLQVKSYVTSKERSKFSRELLIDRIILAPRMNEVTEE